MPMMCRCGGFTDCNGMEVSGGFGGEDVADIATGVGGGGWTALVGEHVLCKLLEGIVGHDGIVVGGGG